MARIYQRIEDVPPRKRALLGTAVAAVGLLAAGLILREPAKLKVPLEIGLAACAVFGFAGAAIGLYGRVSPRVYLGLIVAVLAAMTAVPLWIAFFQEPLACAVNVPALAGETPCRVAFGLGGAIGVMVTALAVSGLFRGPPAS